MKFWAIPTASVTYTRSQNYTTMVVGKHGIQTFKVVVVVLLLLLLSFDSFIPTSAHSLLFLDKWFVQIYECQFELMSSRAVKSNLVLHYPPPNQTTCLNLVAPQKVYGYTNYLSRFTKVPSQTLLLCGAIINMLLSNLRISCFTKHILHSTPLY